MTVQLHHCHISISCYFAESSVCHILDPCQLNRWTDWWLCILAIRPYACHIQIQMHAYISSTGYCHCISRSKSVPCRELLARLVLTTPVRQQYVFCLNLQPTLNTFALGFSSCMVRYIIFWTFSYAFTCKSAASKLAKIQQRVILIKKNYGR